MTAAPSFMDPNYLLDTFGLYGFLLVIFAECGLLIGFFLPGDTLLFTAGLLVSSGVFHQSLWTLLIVAPIAAIVGNIVGYGIGYRAGPAVFDRPDSRLFKREHVEKAHDFFNKYGPITVILARFVPVVRTFVTVMAGVSRMRFATYLVYSIIGGIIWTTGVTVAGYHLGKIKIVRDNVDLILVLGVAAAVCTTALPLALRMVQKRRHRGAHALTKDHDAPAAEASERRVP
ncbi:MAG TPA: DedA family protein [Mycobacteriales bacterium]|nr:DedA family protein [Mycobacteriales bacterium]